jgi:16S rRNA (cytosine967-C5)-methyltransferase
MITARTLAYQLLLHMEQSLSHPDRLIRTVLERHPALDERDRALFTELVYGVLRWQGRLDWHIDQLSNIKPEKIRPTVRILLRLALYQILFLDRVPHHAAVNEAVNLTKASHPAHLVGFVNGMLRAAIRRGGVWEWPSVEQHPAEYLAVTTAHPLWLVNRWLLELGFEEAQSLCQANNHIAPMALRVNTLRAETAQALEWLQQHGFHIEPSPQVNHALRVSSPRQDISQCAIYQQGWIQIQDEASQLVAHLVSPRPGERVLDLCSGFGGKTTHLAALMGNEGSITAVDASAWKLEQLQLNAQRQGIDIIHSVVGDIRELSGGEWPGFDRVFIDAPCSGFGALRRNPDIKWRRHPKDPYRFGRLQGELLQHAAHFVKEGGILVYATCTMMPEENATVAAQFTGNHPRFVVEPAVGALPEASFCSADGQFFQTWPHRHDADGFFAARWRRV